MSEFVITKDNFNTLVLQSKGPLLLDFWAEWCGPCRMTAPVLSELDQEIPELNIGKIDVEQQPELATAFRVRGIPTLVLFVDGEARTQTVGYTPKGDLIQMIQDFWHK